MRESPIVLESEEELAVVAAAEINALISESVSARGRACIALSGGATPRRAYGLLDVLGDRTDVFLVDERMVEETSPQSNFGLVRDTVRGARVHPVQTQGVSPDVAACQYEAEARATTDRFDVVVLGLGSDGHTASLFPHASSLEESDRWYVATPSGSLPPAVERVTMTFPVINRARTVVFLVSGEAKAVALERVLSGGADVGDCPAIGVRPEDGRLVWFVDKAAMTLATNRREGQRHDG